MVESLLFLRLFNQFCKKCAEHISAVLSQCGSYFVDTVMQLFDCFIRWLGFCKQFRKVTDEGVRAVIIDDFIGFFLDLLVFFRRNLAFFIQNLTRRCATFQKGSKSRRSRGERLVVSIGCPHFLF